MLDEVSGEKIEEIALEIINMSRNRLLVNLRFLDMALSRLETVSKPELTSCTATDGRVYLYDPKHILTSYRVEENLPVRGFLHSVFHCVFKHMFVNAEVDARLWNIACDAAVESTVNDLELPYLDTLRAERQKQFLEGFGSELSSVSAEKVYRFLVDKRLPEKTVRALEILFKCDDHEIWYMTDEQKAEAGLAGYRKGAGGGSDGNSDGAFLELAEDWESVAERMKMDMEAFVRLRGKVPGLLTQNLREVTRERYNYTEFLKKFAVRGEAMKINPDEFDYNFYTYGLELYGDMPLIEPLEYKDVKRIREFVIAIDTSGSVEGELVQAFIQKTYNILSSEESFFTKINLHIIQCDAAIQEDVKITTRAEFDEYLKKASFHGFGGTDFRPVFSYVNSLVEAGEFANLRGLIYFTDGFGEFPAKKPPYDAAFVFVSEEYDVPYIPAWAMKLVLRKDEI
ncbi:MAG: VWA-like domain-containing protein [Lachnospiraceae bacterium]|nr:VWA-like domain-containing protein [Ruminococcus sp.]MCM1274436.1 VWA-like domain-containing protein [Lachnospiraceae bacterium]